MLCTVIVMAAGTVPAQQSGSKPAAKTDVGSLFRDRCVTCHSIPDTSIATDRAWLDQIHRTA
jgi:hypothetical protein